MIRSTCIDSIIMRNSLLLHVKEYYVVNQNEITNNNYRDNIVELNIENFLVKIPIKSIIVIGYYQIQVTIVKGKGLSKLQKKGQISYQLKNNKNNTIILQSISNNQDN